MIDFTLPLKDRELRQVPEIDEGYDEEVGRESHVVTDVKDATVITSREVFEKNGTSEWHQVVLDIDVPVKVLPSSTEGHHHLYIRHDMPWEDYVKLLDVLAEIGLVEEGYVEASKREGFTSVRLPWVTKGHGYSYNEDIAQRWRTEEDQGPAASCHICVGAGIVEDIEGERPCVCQPVGDAEHEVPC